MALGFSTTLRNSRAQAIIGAVGTGGKLSIYNGTRPASGGAATTLLAEFTFTGALASAPTNGVITLNIPNNATGLTDGTATWARISTSVGAFVIDLSVGSDITLNTTTVSTGLVIQLTSGTITEGNA